MSNHFKLVVGYFCTLIGSVFVGFCVDKHQGFFLLSFAVAIVGAALLGKVRVR